MLSEGEVASLLERLCVELGFCVPPQERGRFADRPPADVPSFVEAVLRAEGLEPAHVDQQLRRAVESLVSQAFRRASLRGADA